MRAFRINRTGGPEVLELSEVAVPEPGPGEVRIQHGAIGVNYIDTYHRSGLYPVALPSGIGLEAAGTVTAVGQDVSDVRVGDRLGYCTGPIGAYAESHVVPVNRAIKLPNAVSDEVAAASMLKGLTACFLLKRTYPLKAGDVCVIYAAAGGVGQIAVQWAKHLGATVIAVVGTEQKATIARDAGANYVVLSSEPVAERVREFTKGVGADVVYDSVGKDTLQASLDSLRPMGMLVSFGNASGPPADVSPGVLANKGSLFLTRPRLFDYARTREDMVSLADDLFAVIASGAVRVARPERLPLSEAQQAHRRLEARATTGSLVLTS